MAGFVQLVEFEAADVEAVQATLQTFRSEHPEVMTFSVSTLTEDRDRPGTYVAIVEFSSHDEAMAQSNNPLLSEFAGNLTGLLRGPQRFRNLDVKAVTRPG
jgi:quinol monooxygenase YgiN